MHHILVAGAGKIGRLIACFLAESGDYKVYLSDSDPAKLAPKLLGNQHNNIECLKLDVTDKAAFSQLVNKTNIQSVVVALPYFCNVPVAENAREHNLNYFDLTEDTEVTRKIRTLAEGTNTAFVPQCGLAPGFISICAHDLIQHFDKVDTVLMRVGALPQCPSNALKYSLTWSTEGVINEYGNTCYGIQEGKETALQPLEGLETIQIDGQLYEAFNTSGGLGSLAETYMGKVMTMNYKTIRYPGHCEQMHFLMNGLKLNHDRETLKRILENALPKTYQDVVLVYVAVNGRQNGKFIEEIYLKKIYPQHIAGRKWAAIQVTTAGSVCAVVDKVVKQPDSHKGVILQESFILEDITKNRFGFYYA